MTRNRRHRLITVLVALVSLLFMQLLDHTDALSFDSPEETTLVTVLRYIEENYRSGSLGEIAHSMHYELTALSRLIKQKTGKTYTELVQEKRLSQAAWMLQNTDRRVEEISLAVGYENQSYFYRLFEARFGCAPRSYRLCK